jgi:hypothetical protein
LRIFAPHIPKFLLPDLSFKKHWWGRSGNGDALSKAARASCGLVSGVYEWTLISFSLFLSEAVFEVGFTAKRLSLDTRPGAGG